MIINFYHLSLCTTHFYMNGQSLLFKINLKGVECSHVYDTIVHLKHLNSCFFKISFINIYFSFQNSMHTAKQMQYTLGRILSDFLRDVFLLFFINKEILNSIGLYNGKKNCSSILGCHDLDMANR